MSQQNDLQQEIDQRLLGQQPRISAQRWPGNAALEQQAMTNSRLHAAIALGSVLIVGAFVAFLPSVLPASERSQANRICREEGISQASELHEICLAQTIRALEREDYWLARSFARVAADAHEACLRVGLQPETDGFRTCLDNESYARSLMVPRGDRR